MKFGKAEQFFCREINQSSSDQWVNATDQAPRQTERFAAYWMQLKRTMMDGWPWPECVYKTYQVRFPLRRAAYVDLAKRNEEDVAHERVLQQATDERPLPVIFFHKPAGG